MTLDETQQLFIAAVTKSKTATVAQIDACFLPSATMPAKDRVEIYASMFFWRQVDALREDFPHLAQLLGERAFEELCRAYVVQVPSTHPDLGTRGNPLAEFLRLHPALGQRPDAADLARLEWARAEVFYEAEADVLDVSALGPLGNGALAAVRFSMLPSLRCLFLDFDVAKVWRALEAGAPSPAPLRSPTAMVVWRPELDVVHSEIEADEAKALAAVLAGATLGEALEAFAEHPDAAQAALRALKSWFAEGWVTGLG